MTAGKHLSRRLEQLLPGVIGKRYRALTYDQVIPHIADLQAGAAEVVRDNVNEVGEAAILSDNASDIPVVDLGMTEDRYRTLAIATSISYSMLEMRAIEKAGNADMVESRKLLLANRVIEEKDNKLAYFGNPALGLTGLLNDAAVPLDNTNTIDFHNAATTAKTMYEFILDELATIADGSNNAEIPSDLLVTPKLCRRWKTVTVSNNADRSVYEYLLANGITSITEVVETKASFLEANGVLTAGTDKDRIVFYPREDMGMIDGDLAQLAEVMERHVEPTQTAPEQYHETRDMRTVVPIFKCVTPTIINYKNAMKYFDVAAPA